MSVAQHRTIDISNFAKLTPPRSFGKVQKLDWLPISSLVIDPGYQREITSVGRKNIRHIAENFNWSMFAPVLVAAVGGNRYAIVDGQHRTTAAALVGIEKVPCAIIDALRGEQAEAFRAVNANVTRLHTTQLFHAAVTSGDAESSRVVEVCRRAGVTVARSPGTRRKGETLCVAVIAKGIARHGDDVVMLALKAIVHSGDGAPEELNRAIISCVIDVLGKHPHWRSKEKALLAAFEEFALEEMWQKARADAARVKGVSTNDRLTDELTKGLAATLGKSK